MEPANNKPAVKPPPLLSLALAALAGLAPSCAALRPAREPIPALAYPAAPSPAPCLLVLLPGRWDRVGDFERRGFLADLAAAGVTADAMAVDAHLGYYRRGSILTRLRQDVLEPARRTGYRAIWLVGISMGGTGAILYDFSHPGEVDGIFLIAPFLGETAIVHEVEAAGGVTGWRDPGSAGQPFERDLWRWAQRIAAADTERPPVLLGFGAADDFAPAHRLLARVLPPERVFVEPGGHDWRPWRAAWRRFLASQELAPCHPPTAPRR